MRYLRILKVLDYNEPVQGRTLRYSLKVVGDDISAVTFYFMMGRLESRGLVKSFDREVRENGIFVRRRYFVSAKTGRRKGACCEL
jgi:repressor of nif and glnA expression